MRPLIAGNWKMNGALAWAEKPAEFDAAMPRESRKTLDILICAPALYIHALVTAAAPHDVLIGAQNCHFAESGAHTGETSAKMLGEVGAGYVIVGHSERRIGGETNSDIKLKGQAALTQGLAPIVCVGETLAQREAGTARDVVGDQLRESLPFDSAVSEHGEIVIAYEPIWAIGTGKTPTLDDIAAMHDHIREIAGAGVRILYGGSVKPANAKDILAIENVNGALIGGASLEMASLAQIAQAAL